jgi:hypothetical protein
LCGRYRRCNVAVTNQQDLRAGRTKFGDQRLVTLTLEHHHGDLPRRHPLRPRDAVDVLRRRRVDVHGIDALRSDGDLVHVHGGSGEEHRAAFGDGDHRDRIRLTERRQPRPLEWIHGDVDLRPGAVADRFAVEEHRGLVLLALADDDDPVH